MRPPSPATGLLLLLAACGLIDEDEVRVVPLVPAEPVEAPRPAPAPPVVAPPVMAPAAVVAGPPPPWRRATTNTLIRQDPTDESAKRGSVLAGSSFAVSDVAPTEGHGCKAGWVPAFGGGWSCLDHSEPTDVPPGWTFAPPLPEAAHLDHMAGEDAPLPGERDLPLLYGRPRGGTRYAYADLKALAAGKPDPKPLDGTLRFHTVVETPQGTMLTRTDGHLVRLDQLTLYAASPFAGTRVMPVAPAVPAWSIARTGLSVRAGGSTKAELLSQAPYHSLLSVTPSDVPGWWTTSGGYVSDSPLARWIDAPPPEGVGDAVWIDVVLSEQVMAVRRGAELLYVTLISTGKPGFPTPTGIFTLTDKVRWWDMKSRADSPEPYLVEGVPWTMHFLPRYALHGAFWHDDFGRVRSHGCVNLAPADAAAVFESVSPALPPGWHMAYAAPDQPGSVLRIRLKDEVAPERRFIDTAPAPAKPAAPVVSPAAPAEPAPPTEPAVPTPPAPTPDPPKEPAQPAEVPAPPSTTEPPSRRRR